jgi:hypothetical protein
MMVSTVVIYELLLTVTAAVHYLQNVSIWLHLFPNFIPILAISPQLCSALHQHVLH